MGNGEMMKARIGGGGFLRAPSQYTKAKGIWGQQTKVDKHQVLFLYVCMNGWNFKIRAQWKVCIVRGAKRDVLVRLID